MPAPPSSPPARARRVAIVALAGPAVLLLASLAALPAASHYVRLEGKLAAPGTFTFGVALSGRPFAWQRDGVLRGFELDVARAVADAHGLEFRAVRIARTRLLAALRAGEVDAVSTFAIEATDTGAEPESTVMVPYAVTGDHAMVLRGNPFRVSGWRDLAGRTVAATSGSSAEAFARELNARLREAGHEPMHVHSFPFRHMTHFPVSMGHAAAWFVDTRGAVGITLDPESRTRLLEGLFRPRREVGMAVRAEHEDLVHAVEHAVAGMVATGKFSRLLEAHDLPAELSPYRGEDG